MATTKNNSVKFLSGERWKELELKKGVTTKRYAISNRGRIVSFKTKIEEGYILRPRLTQGYPSVTIGREANRQNYYLHRLVAEYFTKKPSPKHNFVIHVDHMKENNKADNLKWVKHEDQISHALKDPNVVLRQNPEEGPKLNAGKVRQIKRALKAKNQPTLKALAKQFKVSDMQIHRIKTGENWSHVTV
ncbi:HNH endonuclease [Fulvivirgaceae bacterium PWU4]|uniref:HNH endonuclease n=1 Tax=Chryseosolibacter histidini TaxID=2782349 RepID=A0AAP2GJL8_9BACT|nr:NUMOD4 domain-containing protein [Chryseosolibacter histidini]MBT1698481.1 HNH endonuclease [Chryseosolibacter histidini]